MAKKFLELLKDKEKNPSNLPAAKPLNEFAAQISEYVGAPGKCEIVLGGIVKYGQEYRAVLTFPPLDYAQNFFRVYISMTDQKVTFHPSGGVVETDVANLSARLLAFLELPALRETLQYFKVRAQQFRKEGRVS